jgi:hypothetical protein
MVQPAVDEGEPCVRVAQVDAVERVPGHHQAVGSAPRSHGSTAVAPDFPGTVIRQLVELVVRDQVGEGGASMPGM